MGIMSITEPEVAQRIQERFEFYIIALCFTLLALSIQTASFGIWIISDVLELSGWLSLTVSGIAGLWRIEWLPVAGMASAKLDNMRGKATTLRELKLKGTKFVSKTGGPVNLESNIRELDQFVAENEPRLESLDKRNMTKYKIHRLTFVLGFILLVLSRASVPVMNMLGGSTP